MMLINIWSTLRLERISKPPPVPPACIYIYLFVIRQLSDPPKAHEAVTCKWRIKGGGHSQLAAWGMTDGASRTGCVPIDQETHHKRIKSNVPLLPSLSSLSPHYVSLQRRVMRRGKTWRNIISTVGQGPPWVSVNLHNIDIMRASAQGSNKKFKALTLKQMTK